MSIVQISLQRTANIAKKWPRPFRIISCEAVEGKLLYFHTEVKKLKNLLPIRAVKWIMVRSLHPNLSAKRNDHNINY